MGLEYFLHVGMIFFRGEILGRSLVILTTKFKKEKKEDAFKYLGTILPRWSVDAPAAALMRECGTARSHWHCLGDAGVACSASVTAPTHGRLVQRVLCAKVAWGLAAGLLAGVGFGGGGGSLAVWPQA